MKNRIGLLLVVFVVQGLLVAWLYFGANGNQEATEPFLQLNPDTVTAMTLTDGEGQQLTLTKAAQKWMVGKNPADATKINALLSKLATMQTPWPVATTKDTQERFEVSEGAFQRRLELTDEAGATTKLYLGSSPGFRRTHAREASSDAIYSIDFANHELPLKKDDWLDRGLLALADEVNVVRLKDQWQLTRQGDAWQIQDLAQGTQAQPADDKLVATLVGRFADLQVIGLTERPSVEEEGGESPMAEFTLSAGEKTYTYRVFRDEEADSYDVARQDVVGRYQLANYIAEQMMPAAADLRKLTDSNATVEGVIDDVLQALPKVNTP